MLCIPLSLVYVSSFLLLFFNIGGIFSFSLSSPPFRLDCVSVLCVRERTGPAGADVTPGASSSLPVLVTTLLVNFVAFSIVVVVKRFEYSKLRSLSY